MMIMQKTIRQEISSLGCGLHSGRSLQVTLKPAPENSGILFLRTDLASPQVLAAYWENVTSTVLATTLGKDENKISTVEHLIAALITLGVDNILVEVNGAELPIFDGSAAEWVKLILAAGLREQSAPRRILKITRPHKFTMGDKSIEVSPSSHFSVEAHIDFNGSIGRHCFCYIASRDSFIKEISRSRTFCLLKDVEMMHSKGLALGGSLDNAVVVGDDGVLNPDGLRYDNEFVRHKILDFIGDLAMIGAPVLGKFILHKPGHELNRLFIADALGQTGLLVPSNTGTVKQRRTPARKSTPGLLPRLSLSLDETAWSPTSLIGA